MLLGERLGVCKRADRRLEARVVAQCVAGDERGDPGIGVARIRVELGLRLLRARSVRPERSSANAPERAEIGDAPLGFRGRWRRCADRVRSRARAR